MTLEEKLWEAEKVGMEKGRKERDKEILESLAQNGFDREIILQAMKKAKGNVGS